MVKELPKVIKELIELGGKKDREEKIQEADYWFDLENRDWWF